MFWLLSFSPSIVKQTNIVNIKITEINVICVTTTICSYKSNQTKPVSDSTILRAETFICSEYAIITTMSKLNHQCVVIHVCVISELSISRSSEELPKSRSTIHCHLLSLLSLIQKYYSLPPPPYNPEILFTASSPLNPEILFTASSSPSSLYNPEILFTASTPLNPEILFNSSSPSA